MPVKSWSDEDANAFGMDSDEVDGVLAALRGMLRKLRSPVVRACLEAAHDDIAHLMERDALPAESEEESEVA
jgi:hypothetical protein